MTCYFRHIKRVFEEIGLEVTKENKGAIDRVIHEIVGVNYKDCPSTWKEVKKRLAEDEEDFIQSLHSSLSH
ncbi:MAG: hypothetical protein ACFFD6_05095 [Candidatus Thorarchaeota archaeon]